VLFDNDLLKALKSEIQPVFEKDGTLQADLLFQSCPLLSSTCEEVMRLTNWPIGTRTVTAETYIGGKKLRPGRKLMMPYRSMHSDTNVFGADAAQFNPRRFMDNKALLKSTSYRPFGGAAHYCPGRFIARMEVQMFVAVMLNRFKIRLVDSSGKKASFPKMDDSLPSGGIQAPAKGHDLIIRVTPA
jgi:cholesterol 7alpha-monooxygenase